VSVAPVIPIASAMPACVFHSPERTSTSTWNAAAEPPASAIARSKAFVARRAVRVRWSPIGVVAGRRGMGVMVPTFV
jgi:hypothetical protein